MTLDMFLERSGISLILVAVCLYYAWRVLVMKDLSSIRSKDKPPARDPEGYCRAAGRLILFFSAASFVMSLLMVVSPLAGLLEIVAATACLGIAWKNVEKRYGA
ncbi:MAG: hypothetical protein J6N19_11095 [Clostridium sp.]|nr:hypothetical protein [Clostridium sp.]